MHEALRAAHITRRISAHLLRNTAIAAGLAGLAAPLMTASGEAAAADPAPRSTVGLAINATGTGFGFYRGVDDAVYMRTFYDATGWSAQSRIGGQTYGAPAAAVAGSTVVVAVRGVDDAIWVRTMHNGTWSPWTSWGGRLNSAPAVAGGSDGRIDVFARGVDNALWSRTLPAGGTLQPWTSLGGQISTAPAAVTIQDGHIEIAAAGMDHAVWLKSTSGPWNSIGGLTYSPPALAYIPQSNGVFALVRGVDDALWVNGLAGAPTGWESIGGRLIDGPTAAGTREPRPYAIAAVRGVDQAIWTTTYPTQSGGWSSFTRAWPVA